MRGVGLAETSVILIPMIFFGVLTLCVGVILHYVAKRKGYGWPMLLWAWIPVINLSVGFLVFAALPDQKLHEKIDRLLSDKPQKQS